MPLTMNYKTAPKRNLFGGMPDYINDMRQPQPAMGGVPDMSGILAQAQQAQAQQQQAPQGPSPFEIFNKQFEKPKPGLKEGLSMVGGMLQDMDGTMGSGNYDRAVGRYDKSVEEARGAFTQQQQMALMQAAAQGDKNALFMLDPSLALGEKRDERNFGYQQGQDTIANTRADRGIDLQSRGVDLQERGLQQNADQFGVRTGMDQDQFGQTMKYNYDKLNADNAMERAKLDADAAEARQGGALAGLPAGVQSAIVGNELKNIDQAGSAADSAAKASALAKRFVDESKDWNSQGGGWWNDIGQALSNKTAGLKGITAEMVPMMRSAGEGIMTDADAKRYESAVVSINKPRGSNEDVSAVFAAGERNAKDYEDFLRGVMADGRYGDQQQAQRIWDAYAQENPVFDAETGQPVQNRVPIQQWMQGAQGGGGDTTFDDVAQISEGALVEDENGTRWRKQGGQLVRAN